LNSVLVADENGIRSFHNDKVFNPAEGNDPTIRNHDIVVGGVIDNWATLAVAVRVSLYV
jgi:hypothetical protein